MLIYPIVNSIDRDLQVLQSLSLRPPYTLDTHIEADHITAVRHFKERVGSKIAAPAVDRLSCAGGHELAHGWMQACKKLRAVLRDTPAWSASACGMAHRRHSL